MNFCKEDIARLIDLANNRNIYLEGNILKLIKAEESDVEFTEYLIKANQKDKDSRRKRLEITRRVQSQNTELINSNAENAKLMEDLRDTLKAEEESKKHIEEQNTELLSWKDENERISEELKEALQLAEMARLDAEKSKENAENDLDILQKKTQFELMERIVKTALYIIIGIGIVVTVMYMIILFAGKDTIMAQQTTTIGSTWTNIVGILLTNCFSIVGTIMGVKYAATTSSNNNTNTNVKNS